MSPARTLGQVVQEKEHEQSRKSAATEILTGVREWRGNKVDIAKKRWIWELIQNAVDCGTREQKDVTITITFEDGKLIFEHNGGPFLPEELSALILGGSTKPFKPESPYTGKFGIGFLVTHILSLRVFVEGIAKTEQGENALRFTLDRSGDEVEDILGNIKTCYDSLNEDIENEIPNTRYTYYLDEDDGDTLNGLLTNLKRQLPYVMLFQGRLRMLHLRSKSITAAWELKNRSEADAIDGELVKSATIGYTERTADVVDPTAEIVEVFGFSNAGVSCGMSVKNDGVRRTCLSNDTIPKIFAPYPLVGNTEKIGIPLIIYGEFEPSEDRDTVLLSGTKSEVSKNREKIKVALELLPKAIQYAIQNKIGGAYLLARLAKTSAVPEEEWWNENLRHLVSRLVDMEIVETEEGFKKPKDEKLWFLVPLLGFNKNIAPEYEDFKRNYFNKFWDFDKKVYADQRVQKDIAYDWQLNIRHWLALGPSEEIEKRIESINQVCDWFLKNEGKTESETEVGIADLIVLLEILDNVESAAKATACALLRDYPIMLDQMAG